MKYNLERLIYYVTNNFNELFFDYGNKKIMITPFDPNHFEIYIDEETFTFDDFDELLAFKIDNELVKDILTKVEIEIA